MEQLNEQNAYVRWSVDEAGTPKASLRMSVWRRTPEGMDDELVASINIGDPMNTAAQLARLAVDSDFYLKSDWRRAQKMKRIRKAMGYSYP